MEEKCEIGYSNIARRGLELGGDRSRNPTKYDIFLNKNIKKEGRRGRGTLEKEPWVKFGFAER